jgi:NAD+ diphosphatase
MIGLIGEAESDTLTTDGKELEEARWFAPDEVRLMLERKHPSGLFAPHPFAIANRLVEVALQSSSPSWKRLASSAR